MRAWTRAVALLVAAVLIVAPAVGPTCAAACTRATDRVALTPAPSSMADHCARQAHGTAHDPAAGRVAAVESHRCRDHAQLVAGDARLPRPDAGIPLPPIGAAAVVDRPAPARVAAGWHSGLAPPGPVRAPVVLRV